MVEAAAAAAGGGGGEEEGWRWETNGSPSQVCHTRGGRGGYGRREGGEKPAVSMATPVAF